jgi:DNA-binding NarL/FixJ family response regulator
LGDAAVARLWARGAARSSEDAVALALAEERPEGASLALSVVKTSEVAAAPPSLLTRREQQIAALVAAGHSNKDIAAELSISPATAAWHVANIMAKLGFRSRTQVAAWVADQQ